MVRESPSFWWQKPGLLYYLLGAAAWIYGKIAAKAFERKNIPQIAAPVLCLGNYTLGGSGKTPLAMAMAQQAKKMGFSPGFVTRGYGGNVRYVHLVDKEKDCARLVGDEPLLLAQIAPTMLAVDRFMAAQALLKRGCDFIIMDDGFQSRRLYMDYALLVVDAMRGFGNGAVFPAGPLRAPLRTQIAYSSAIALIGKGEGGLCAIRPLARAGKQIFRLSPHSFASQNVRGCKLLGFCAIGNPYKFYDSIISLGGLVIDKRSYGDHHFFTIYDIKDLQETARNKSLSLATTLKDYIRLKKDHNLQYQMGAEAFAQFLAQLIVFDIEFNEEDIFRLIVKETEKRFYARRRW